MKQHVVFDTEIIGRDKPVFMIGTKIIETGETQSFWAHRKKDLQNFIDMIYEESFTWVSFNGIRFDDPLIQLYMHEYDAKVIKTVATQIIEQNMMPWDVLRSARIHDPVKYDHIDLIDVAPGVRISLKTYAGRMEYPSMVDLPFDHNKDLNRKEQKILEEYCLNDLGVTEALFQRLRKEIDLRADLSAEHGIELRSKSDAQVAEAILKKAVGIHGRSNNITPKFIKYKTPSFIKTDNERLLYMIERLEAEEFLLKNGSPILPPWLENTVIQIGNGEYKVGIGGLHSQHDKKVHYKDRLISDFDVASYYPSIMLACGLTPNLSGNKGAVFLDAYRRIYERRVKAKREGDKAVADALKISLNGTFGKLGSPYSALYAPELMLAVTITGQLNLLMLIAELVKIKDVEILSANTDGIMVGYTDKTRAKVLKAIEDNHKLTGFDYEETPYREVAMKDVNNYVAITTGGKVKAKGLYADAGLMKNPTMPVCSKAVKQYLLDGTLPGNTVKDCPDFIDFTAIRNVKGGAEWHSQLLGRVVRWYISDSPTRPIRYASNGNKVPKTDNAQPVMTLPEKRPHDIDYVWYVNEAYSMLEDMGVQL